MIQRPVSIYHSIRAVVLALLYTIIICASIYLSYEIRFDFTVPTEAQHERLQVLWLVIPIKLLALLFSRQMGSMVTFFGISDFIRLGMALLISAGLLIIPRFTAYGQFSTPRGVLLIDFLVCLATFCLFRLGARLFRERILIGRKMQGRVLERVVIIGAGDTGASLVSDLINMPARGFRPVAFLDDDRNKHRQFIHGVEVVGTTEEFASLPCFEGVRRAIIAMPSAPSKRVGEIALLLGRLGVNVEIVPALEDLASGKARVSRIRPIEIQDLLGRSVVNLDTGSIRQFIENKVVMVTGAGGSIGSELCRQIAYLNPRRLLLVEQSEPALFLIEQELNGLGFSGMVLPVVADIMDQFRINALFEVHSPQVIFHAAAHKHVYLMERQPSEAIKNNAIGARRLAETAIARGVEAFVLISTDKAVNPTNVMGASKRLAELHLQALHAVISQRSEPQPSEENREIISRRSEAEGSTLRAHFREQSQPEHQSQNAAFGSPALPLGAQQLKTKLLSVRFGNVLGSSGSVVPIFKKQIELGGPVTVTHQEVTRYFMTIPEAAGLVLQSGAIGQGGEIFVLDMGQPVKIVDLAKKMIELSGYKLHEDIEIVFTGLKPGEKLFEELRRNSEEYKHTNHPSIMQFVTDGDASKASRMAIEELEPFVDQLSVNDIKRRMKIIMPEYEPFLE